MMVINKIFLLFLLFFVNYEISKSELTDYSKKNTSVYTLDNFNRRVFSFNEKFYKYTIYPIYNSYGAYVPFDINWLLKISGQNYLDTSADIVFSLLELDLEAFLISIWRFSINSTIGVFGLFDVANSFGLRSCRKSFDMVLDRYGIPEGQYIVLPIIGPSVLRSSFNDVAKLIAGGSFLAASFGLFGGLGSFGGFFNYNIPKFPLFYSTYSLGVITYVGYNFWIFDNKKEAAFDIYSEIQRGYVDGMRNKIAQNRKERESGRLRSDNKYENNNYLFKDEDLDQEDIDYSHESNQFGEFKLNWKFF